MSIEGTPKKTRPWLKRITYLLVGSVAVGAGSVWFAHSSTMQKVYIKAISTTIKDVTGLEFNADGMGFSILRGRVRFYGPSLDTDLFRADEIRVSANPMALIGDSPRIRRVTIINPVVNISAVALDKLEFKQSDGQAPSWTIDKFEIRNGKIAVNEPSWGLPRAEAGYQVIITGLGPEKFRAEAVISDFTVDLGAGEIRGGASLRADFRDDIITLHHLEIDSGLLKLKADGGFNNKLDGAFGFETMELDCKANGSVYTQNLAKLFGEYFSKIDGQVDFSVSVSGGLYNPAWTLQANSKSFKTPYFLMDNGAFTLEAVGGPVGIELKNMEIITKESSLQAIGELRSDKSLLELKGTGIPLAPLSDVLKTSILDSVSIDMLGRFSTLVPLWSDEGFGQFITRKGDDSSKFQESVASAMRRFQATLDANFSTNGKDAGLLKIAADAKALQIIDIKTDFPELQAAIQGSMEYKLSDKKDRKLGFDLISFEASAKDVVTTAVQVARVLNRWDIADLLPIFGDVQASALLSWTPADDFRLMNGEVRVTNPGYDDIRADFLTSSVRIENQALYLDDIKLFGNEAEIDGNLWLTWADVPIGSREIFMKYDAKELSLSQGLKMVVNDTALLRDMAAEGQLDVSVVLEGPYDSIELKGCAALKNGSVYGISVPVLRTGEVKMELSEDNLVLKIPEFVLADDIENMGFLSTENLDSLNMPLGIVGELEIDLTSQRWNGRAKGFLDSRALGITDTSLITLFLDEAVFDSPFVSDYGPLSLPEGSIKFRNGQITLNNHPIGGLGGDFSIGAGQVSGEVHFEEVGDGSISKHTLVELKANKSIDRHTGKSILDGDLHIDFSTETAETTELAQALTGGILRDIKVELNAKGELNENMELTWDAEIGWLTGKILDIDFSPLGRNALSGDSKMINLLFDVGSRRLHEDDFEPPSFFRVEGCLPLDSTGVASLRLDGTIDLEHARDVLAGVFKKKREDLLAGFIPAGSGKFNNVSLKGPYHNLGLFGEFNLRGGLVPDRSLYNFPYEIENLKVDLTFYDKDVKLNNLSGKLLRGTFEGEGSANWTYEGLDNYYVKTNLNNFYYHHLPKGFHIDGNLEAELQKQHNKNSIISGILTANNVDYTAEIDLRNLILNNSAGSIPSLKNIDLNDPLDKIDLSIKLQLNQPWSINTNLLKIRGNVHATEILGTLGNPGLRGRIDFLPGGRITNILPAGDIIVEKGSIDFHDSSIFNPVFDILGQIDLVPFRVNLNIHGPLDTLNIAPTSTPSLRQDEVISILLNPALAQTIGASSFTGSSSTSAATSSGLAGAAGGLMTNLMLTSFQEQFRRALKLDRVSVAWRTGTSGASETDVIIGKNITLMEHSIPMTGSYKTRGDIATIGGQLEWRVGNLVIQLGASGSRTVSPAPAGEIRYTWSTR